MKKALVIGGGFAGCIAAQMLSKKGHDVTLVERAPFFSPMGQLWVMLIEMQ